jgi:hypothetical protein
METCSPRYSRSMKCQWVGVLCAGVVLIAGCTQKHSVHVFLDETYPDKLSEWGLSTGAGVHAYEVRTSLFANYTDKHRTMWMPPGKSAAARADGTIDFPVGTVFSKTFSVTEHGKERRIETRLLVHRAQQWIGLPYVWNREQTEAALAVSGDFTTVRGVEYAIPNVNQCRSCHDQGGNTVPLGPTVRNLDAATLTRLGIRPPAVRPDTLDSRARAYLDVNCGTCHNPSGSAPRPLERSLLLSRMQSTLPKVGMPPIGHSVVDKEGVALISKWIRAMKRS